MLNMIFSRRKHFVYFIVSAVFLLVCSSNSYSQRGIRNDTTIYFADPCIYPFNGTYYLYGTTEENANNGFVTYTSTDLVSWKKSTAQNGNALMKSNAFGKSQFWAPQVVRFADTFYMAYAANEQIAIAKAVHPAGPFVQQTIAPLSAPVKQIDPFVFVDSDGKKYLYHVRLTNGNRIFVAEMEADFSAIKPSTLKECITATEPWENTANSSWPVTEGPSVFKHKGVYYLFYTANDYRNPDYAVGYATSNSPYGPWKKYNGSPVISRKLLGINGTGHGDFFRDAQNNLLYVFHTHFSNEQAGPRKTAVIKFRIVKDKKAGVDKVVADVPTFYFLKKAVS
jgi:beta-xylosidase